MEIIQVPYPPLKPRIRNTGASTELFCLVRKKWLKATPEEWVRQHFLLYLTEVLGYPLAVIAVEKSIRVGERKKRFDILVYHTDLRPHIIIECKSPTVPLESLVMTQVLSYYSVIQSGYLVICNGPSAYFFRREGNNLVFINQLPYFYQCN